jgi:hypothetical protein
VSNPANGGGASVFGPLDANRALTLAAAGNPSFTGVSYHTSAQAIPIPIMWGTRRVSPNTIWVASVLDFTVQPFGTFGPGPPGYTPGTDGVNFTVGVWQGRVTVPGSSYGEPDLSNSNSINFVPVIQALCEGPIDDVPRIWNGGGSAAQTWAEATNLIHIFGIGVPPCPYYDKTLNGTSTQTSWAYFAVDPAILTLYPGADLAYRFTALIVTPTMPWGHSMTPPQQSFEVRRTPNTAMRALDSYLLAFDYSPAAIIPDLLTSLQYGMGLVSGDIDAATLTTNANSYTNYCFAQGFFLSPLLDAQTAGTDILNRIATETNTWIFWSGVAFMFVPLGDESLTANGKTYTPDATPAYDLSNDNFLASGPLTVDRADPNDCHNRVRFEFPDRRPGTDAVGPGPTSTPGIDYAKNAIEWKDEGLIGQFGIRDASAISADDICDVAVAAVSLDLYGKRMAYIRNTYSFSLSYRFLRILPGTIVTLTDPNLGLDHVPVRVRSVDEDDKGALAIVAEEFTGSLGIARPNVGQAWLPNGVGAGGSGSGGTSVGSGGGSGVPISTSGGGITLTTGVPTILVLFVAGDVINLPAVLTPGIALVFKHDQLRAIQPTPAILEANPVHFVRPGGATWGIEDPQDGSIAAASSVTGRTSGMTVRFVFDGATPGVLRCIQ